MTAAVMALAVSLAGCSADDVEVTEAEARSEAQAIIASVMRSPNDAEVLCSYGLSVAVCERDLEDFADSWPTVPPEIVCGYGLSATGIYVITLRGRDGTGSPYVHHMAFGRDENGDPAPATPVFWLNMEAPPEEDTETPSTLPEDTPTPRPACGVSEALD